MEVYIYMLKALLQKYSNVLIYLLLGALTTAVNYAIYFPLLNIFKLSAVLSNCIAWAVAVLVAFLTNKPYVFKSLDWSLSVVIPEFLKFVVSRLASGALETGFLFITVDLLSINGNIMKLLISIVVVIANYLTGKLIVFKK